MKSQRTAMYEEFTRGSYFNDMSDFRKNKGKRYTGSTRLIDPSMAPKFPKLQATALDGSTIRTPDAFRSCVTLALVHMRQIGDTMANGYRTPFHDQLMNTTKQRGKFELLEVALIDHWFYQKMVQTLADGVRKKTSDERHGSYICYTGADSTHINEIRRDLDIFSSLTAFAFLVDREGRVRWAAHGHPVEAEIESMLRCAKQLQEQQQ